MADERALQARLDRLRDLCAGDGQLLDVLEAGFALSVARSEEPIDLVPFRQHADYAGMARAAGLERVYQFSDIQAMIGRMAEIIDKPGHTFTVLDVEPLGRRAHSPPLDGPEVKFRFGRYLERRGGPPILDTPLK